MTLSCSGARFRSIGLAAALLTLALLVGACAAPGATPSNVPTTAVADAPTASAATVAPTQAPAEGATPSGEQATDAEVGVNADGHFYRGNPNAAVKLEEFSDFQCPFCARHTLQTEPLLYEAYIATGEVQHVFRHFPLDSIHPNARPAAKAAYCAGQQDPKYFWGMHDWLFANQESWSEASDAAAQFRTQAVELGADGAQYDTCVADAASEARVQGDLEEGVGRGVQGTPAFFVNDFFINGAVGIEEFQDKIERAKRGETPAPTPTPLPEGVEFFHPDPSRPGFTYGGNPTLGSAEAPVLLIAFEDFKNPDSATHALEVEPALKTTLIDPGTLRVMFMFYPSEAPEAAAAAYCAGQQGKFWEFRTLLYQKQAEWSEGDAAAMTGYAKELGLDEAEFTACLQDPATTNAINYSFEFAQQQIGVPSAPSYLLLKLNPDLTVANGRGISGTLPLADFEQAIQDIQLPPTPVPTEPPPVSEAQLASLETGMDAEGNFYRGDPNAPIRLTDFSDFQCPFCARHAAQTEPLLYEAYIAAGKVVHVFRHFPLDIHPNAPAAHRAAFCAGQQDPKLFWAMHDWLFANQQAWQGGTEADAAAQFRTQALAAGVKADAYDACLTDAQTEAAIQADMQAGVELGVSGTPAFFVEKLGADGKTTDVHPLSGALPFAQFAEAIDGLLASE